jgi:hypothetical protein
MLCCWQLQVVARDAIYTSFFVNSKLQVGRNLTPADVVSTFAPLYEAQEPACRPLRMVMLSAGF